jgi:hypothetical protein
VCVRVCCACFRGACVLVLTLNESGQYLLFQAVYVVFWFLPEGIALGISFKLIFHDLATFSRLFNIGRDLGQLLGLGLLLGLLLLIWPVFTPSKQARLEFRRGLCNTLDTFFTILRTGGRWVIMEFSYGILCA